MRVVLCEGATMPTKGTMHSAGYDLYSNEDTVVPSLMHIRIHTGVHAEIPQGCVGTISHRSGMNHCNGIFCYGRVDSDYIGEIMVELFNFDKEYIIKKGDRIAQLVIVPHRSPVLVQAKELRVTKRGGKGYGSTGR